ncbi:sodium/potassium-transporting ATPase subunit beta-1 [Drosophila bipectinata]|uniref:sodium/potassium-transporting ATPase subunit beta-1 n=1 Tax=Drosophila bipectinata TaxID=42026 RepID=UPI001C8A775B|nr:sodium/potassium-transporting ATPase subunit beta-1 [Drosophila bipectinata]
MPEDVMVPAGSYKVTKQFRSENTVRSKRDMPWSRKVLDLEKKSLFGRTAWAWIRIFLYFLVFYLFLYGFYFIWRTIISSIFMFKDRPRWFKGAPGLSVFPTNETTISYYQHLMSDVYPLADSIDDHMSKLKDNAEDYFEECNNDKLWGYPSGKPCLFVKLNYVMGFIPDTYDTPGSLPVKAPEELSDLIRKYGGAPKIWLTCKVIQGPSPKIEYIPGPYYTVTGEMKGTARIVAVQLNELKPNSKTFIRCTAWAKNIPINHEFNGVGHVKFSIEMLTKTGEKHEADTWRTTVPPYKPDPGTKPVERPEINDLLDKQALPMVEGEVDVPPLPPLEPSVGNPHDGPPKEPPSV